MSNLIYDDKAVVCVTKEFTFEACHHLLDYDGKCNRPHGHSYKCQVTVKGKLDQIGMVADFKRIKEAIKTKILNEHAIYAVDLDHSNLNEVFSFNTTAENMCVWIYDQISKYLLDSDDLFNVKVEEVKLWETATSFATYRGERL